MNPSPSWARKKSATRSRGTNTPRRPSKAAPRTEVGVTHGRISSTRVVSVSKAKVQVRTRPSADRHGRNSYFLEWKGTITGLVRVVDVGLVVDGGQCNIHHH